VLEIAGERLEASDPKLARACAHWRSLVEPAAVASSIDELFQTAEVS